ncbi:hypothetical protein VSR34_20330 [Paraburkholderia sp. JHI2823]|uniref:hypothetical protein n=1 Tax=Paraburkholderia sp. JHI2823 TaxID=3112960 RepID=UPI00316EE7CA
MYSVWPILGPEPNVPLSAVVLSLGNDGQVAGTAVVSDNVYVGAQWLNGLLTFTLTPPDDSRLFGINDGLVAVGSTTEPDQTQSAIVVDTGKLTNLSPLVGKNSWAAGVNDQGLVCGGHGQPVEGFLYSVPANRLIATVPRLNLVQLNNSGEAIGWNDEGKDCVYSVQSGTTKALDVMVSARDINDAGIACGGYRLPGTCDTRQALPVFQAIPLPAGATSGSANGINNRGDVVGGFFFDDVSFNNGFREAAYLYQNGRTTLLDKLVAEPGWHLDDAVDINNSGQIIGRGTLYGTTTAFMLSPISGGPSWWSLPLQALVGTLLGGVAYDAGGWMIIGGRRVPVSPWGAWQQLQPEKRDALIALAADELARYISDEATRVKIRTALVESASGQLKSMNVGLGRTGPAPDDSR